MLIVVAIGGNALLKRGQPLEADIQIKNVKKAASSIAEISKEHDLVIVHGNGPQVGLLELESINYTAIKPYSLDILTAETQGMIGYLLQQEINNCLPERQVVTLLTRIKVNDNDPAFQNPSKPIGPVYDKKTAEQLAKKHAWKIKPDGDKFRRVVASPIPQKIKELEVIKMLIKQKNLVICAGGGGIPIVEKKQNYYEGIEAVIDKDLAAALLAIQLKADALIILTDVKAVERDWGTKQAKPIRKTTPAELRQCVFSEGSMAPKIDAVCRFVESSSGWAAIGALEDGYKILKGSAGTLVEKV